MNKKIITLVHILIPLNILHLIEEIMTGFYQTDQSLNNVRQFLNLTSQTTFYLIQLLLFIFLGVVLIAIFKKRLNYFLIVPLTLISLYEFVHTHEAIVKMTYTPGLITGTLIGIMGLILLFCLYYSPTLNPN